MAKIDKLQNNTLAIEVALNIEKTGAKPTDKEILLLQSYTGFGELKCILLDPQKPERFSASEQNLIPSVKQLQNILHTFSQDESEYNKYFESLKRSVLTAFYTPKEVIETINQAFQINNLKINSLLDPSAGMGIFLNIHSDAYTAIEKDILTGKILRLLHPDKEILISGFENIPHKYENNFDLVTSNIPFGDYKVFDPSFYNSKIKEKQLACNRIHNYFFLKAIDMAREGGVIAFITSTGLLNSKSNTSLREYLLKTNHLISSVRLPENLFSDTEAQSDLIVLQKNSSRNRKLTENEKLWINTQQLSTGAFQNLFYEDLKNVVHTELRFDTNMYGDPDVRYFHSGGIKAIADDLGKIITNNIKENLDFKLYTQKVQQQEPSSSPVQLSLFDDFDDFVIKQSNPVKKIIEKKIENHFEFENAVTNREGSYQVKGDIIGIAETNGKARILNVDQEQIKLIQGYIKIRDSYFELKNYETNTLSESSDLRLKLNQQYDSFISNFGSITKSARFLSTDISFPEIRSLETFVKDKIIKSDIFNQPIAFSKSKELYTSDEALSISLNKFHSVNLSYISGLTKLSEPDVIKSLEGRIFYNPEKSIYEQADVFLSGNVIEKFNKAAEEYKITESPFIKNQIQLSMRGLNDVIPPKIPFEDIGLSLGERWIPDKYYSAFASEVFQGEMNVRYESIVDEFTVAGVEPYYATQKYAVKSANRNYSAKDVLRFALFDNTPDMNIKIVEKDKTTIIADTEGISKMSASVSLLQEEFKNWLQKLTIQHKEELESLYNSKFNCFVKSKFDGSFQTFPDLDLKALGIPGLYDTQKNAILMIKNQNGGIIDHEVGGGKTLIQCVAAYEMKRLGLVNKPAILGLKANIGQIATTFKTAYPNSKILYATKKDFDKENRKTFFNKIQNNNWDCIIMTHEQFKAIPQSADIQKKIIEEEIMKLEESISNIEDEGQNFKYIERALLKRKENLETRLQNIMYDLNEKRDKVVDFKTMGIDHLFIDESHKFKNLLFQTRHQRVAGLGNSSGSERSLNLLFALRTIQEKNKSDLGATFLSGTTISNSLTELYNIFNYLRPEALKKQDIHSFDAWASIYTIKSKDYEFNVTNDIIQKERFRHFIKVPELAMFYSQITDYKTADDIGVERPHKNEIFIALEQTNQQKDMFLRLKKFAKNEDGTIIYRLPLSDSEKKAKMLIATNTAKKAALDMRLIDDKKFYDEPGNKADIVANKIYEYYQKYDEHKGTQFVFSDIGTYKPGNVFNIYTDVKQKLVEKGIPEDEIQFIQMATSETKRDKLFEKMNNGDCRVLFGSTEMLGTGVNAQQRVVAIHHFDIPWTPKDLEQRNGRGVRKGNEVAKLYAGNKVDVLIYATKETLDTYKFNLLKNKALFISQIKNNNISVRSIDEGGMDKNTGMSFSEYIAVLSGNTDLLEKSKLEKVLTQLKMEENVYLKQIRNKDRNLNNLQIDKARNDRFIDLFIKDLKLFHSIPRDKEGNPVIDYVIREKRFTNPHEIGEKLNEILDKENRDNVNYQKIGSYGKFALIIKSELQYTENGKEIYTNKMFVQGNLKYSYNNGDVARTPKLAALYPINALKRIEGLIKSHEKKNEEIQSKIIDLRSLSFEFPKKDQLKSTEKMLLDLTNKINKSLLSQNETDIENETEIKVEHEHSREESNSYSRR